MSNLGVENISVPTTLLEFVRHRMRGTFHRVDEIYNRDQWDSLSGTLDVCQEHHPLFLQVGSKSSLDFESVPGYNPDTWFRQSYRWKVVKHKTKQEWQVYDRTLTADEKTPSQTISTLRCAWKWLKERIDEDGCHIVYPDIQVARLWSHGKEPMNEAIFAQLLAERAFSSFRL